MLSTRILNLSHRFSFLYNKTVIRNAMSFYAVKRGKETGVFSSWKECEEQIKGYTGARYKKFASEDEAEAFVNAPHSPGKAPKASDGGDEADVKGKKRSHDEEADNKDKGKAEAGKDKEQAEKKQKTGSGKHKVVYTDGCCFFNGKHGATAGIGVFWGQDDDNNLSEKIEGKQTNNKAEILAAKRAIDQAKEMGLDSLEIRTDSQFMIDCASKWMPGWKKKDWKKSDGSEVKNKEELQELDAASEGLDIEWVHVEAHAGHEGNEEADKLAKQGAKKHN